MTWRRLPWSLKPGGDRPLGPGDAHLVEVTDEARHDGAVLLRRGGRCLRLLPYPPRGDANGPPSVEGLPARPRLGDRDVPTRDGRALVALNRVSARIEDLDHALDDPSDLWNRLADRWRAAGAEGEPRMAEIVRQAVDLTRHLPALEARLRRVLRRDRARVPLDRVQEMDRASMVWLARQPGTTVAERAGGAQRILALVRREEFDTLENRVLRAYAGLADKVARDWLEENARAVGSRRYEAVLRHRRLCRRLDRTLGDQGVRRAEPGVTPNYVLMQVPEYRRVHNAWVRLLRDDLRLDDLWRWQAQGWIDFCALALVLTLHGMPGSQLVAQAPILRLPEAVQGRGIRHDRPLAVFWLRAEGLVVEVQPRPYGISRAQWACAAPVWLRIQSLSEREPPMRVPVWATHVFEPPDLNEAAADALSMLGQAARQEPNARLLDGLILVPSSEPVPPGERRDRGRRVLAIGLGGAGAGLHAGLDHVASFLRECVGVQR